MVGMVLVKSLYVLPTWTRAVSLVAEHDALQVAVGCVGDVPSIDACYRFTKKLRAHKDLLDACVAAVIASLKAQMPEFGQNIAIDGSDLPAYANGQRYFPTMARCSARSSPTPTPRGATVRPSRLARRVATTGTRCTPRCARPRVCRSLGRRTPPRMLRLPSSPPCSTSFGPTASPCPRWRWTGATTPATCTTSASVVASVPSFPSGDAVRQARQGCPPKCDHGTWTFAGVGRQARSGQVPLPNR